MKVLNGDNINNLGNVLKNEQECFIRLWYNHYL